MLQRAAMSHILPAVLSLRRLCRWTPSAEWWMTAIPPGHGAGDRAVGSSRLCRNDGAQAIPLAPLVWGMLPPLAIPLAGLVMVVVSIARRVPVTVGVVRGFARLGIPLACLLVLPYAVIVSVQGRTEAREIAMVRAQGRHEGRYLASRLGVEWPGKP